MIQYFFALLTLFCLTIPVAHAQPTETFIETLRIGRGDILYLAWHPDGERFLVDTVNGAWLYRVTDEGRITDDFHIPQAQNARFSSDGRWIAGVDERNQITLWDAHTYQPRTPLTGGDSPIRELEWQPNSALLASLDASGQMRVWDGISGRLIWQQDNGAIRLAWSIDGTYLLTGHLGSNLNVWKADGAWVFAVSPDNGGLNSSLFQWRDDTRFLQYEVGEVPRGVEWDITTGDRSADLNVGYQMSYSPDGSKRVAGGISRSIIYDADTNEILLRINRPLPSAIGWNPTSTRLLLAHGTNATQDMMSYVDTQDGVIQPVETVNFYRFAIQGFYWNPDGQHILIVDQANQIYLNHTRQITSHTHVGAVMAWHDDGQTIAIADTNAGAGIWDAQTGDIRLRNLYTQFPATQLAWQPDGDLLATSAGDGWESRNNQVYIWDTQLSPNSDDLLLNVIPHVTMLTGFAWSPDGETLATLERTRFIRLWQPANPSLNYNFDLYQNRIAPFIDYTSLNTGLAWSKDGERLSIAYTGSGNHGSVYLLDVEGWLTGADGGLSYAPNTTNLSSTFVWTPDNRFISARWLSRLDGTISLQGEGINDDGAVLTGLSAHIRKAIFSPDATMIIGFDLDNHAIIWDVETQAPIHQFDNAYDAVWSPDNAQLAILGGDGFMRIMDVESGETVHQFPRHSRLITSASYQTLPVAWSSDSARIAIIDRGVLFIYDRAG
jgi:WD40 repeat protein